MAFVCLAESVMVAIYLENAMIEGEMIHLKKWPKHSPLDRNKDDDQFLSQNIVYTRETPRCESVFVWCFTVHYVDVYYRQSAAPNLCVSSTASLHSFSSLPVVTVSRAGLLL